MVSGHIKLNRHNGYVTMLQCPYVGILSMIVRGKDARKPVVATVVRVSTLVEFFGPFGVGLAADTDALNGLGLREVHIEQGSFLHAVLQNLKGDSPDKGSAAFKIGRMRKIIVRKPNG